MTIVIAVLVVLGAAVGIGGAHNAYKSGHVLFAHRAGTAAKVTGFTRLPFKKLSPSATDAYEAARAAATKIQLFSKGALTIYAKCFKENGDPSNPGIYAEIYIKTSVGGAIFSSADGNSSSNGFLAPSTPEQQRQLSGADSYAGPYGDPGTLNISDAASTNFYAAVQKTDLIGNLFVGTKVGSPVVGDGVFGAGDRCIFGGTITSR
jgi:hypothetical protein